MRFLNQLTVLGILSVPTHAFISSTKTKSTPSLSFIGDINTCPSTTTTSKSTSASSGIGILTAPGSTKSTTSTSPKTVLHQTRNDYYAEHLHYDTDYYNANDINNYDYDRSNYYNNNRRRIVDEYDDITWNDSWDGSSSVRHDDEYYIRPYSQSRDENYNRRYGRNGRNGRNGRYGRYGRNGTGRYGRSGTGRYGGRSVSNRYGDRSRFGYRRNQVGFEYDDNDRYYNNRGSSGSSSSSSSSTSRWNNRRRRPRKGDNFFSNWFRGNRNRNWYGSGAGSGSSGTIGGRNRYNRRGGSGYNGKMRYDDYDRYSYNRRYNNGYDDDYDYNNNYNNFNNNYYGFHDRDAIIDMDMDDRYDQYVPRGDYAVDDYLGIDSWYYTPTSFSNNYVEMNNVPYYGGGGGDYGYNYNGYGGYEGGYDGGYGYNDYDEPYYLESSRDRYYGDHDYPDESRYSNRDRFALPAGEV